MRIVILEDAEQVSQFASSKIASVVKKRPDAVLGLATGGTPVATYRKLIELHQRGEFDASRVVAFNLDEYVGLDREHTQSYAYFMRDQLFSKINILPENCHIPSGVAADLQAECETYEAKIKQSGGIDLQLLGLGSDGHIAFNEPGSSFGSRTRVKTLTARTVRDNARFFATLEEVPTLALTMGIGTILESRSVLLLAVGESKAEAVRGMVEGPQTASMPASALQWHRQGTVVVDKGAASLLERRDYYLASEANQARLERD